MESIRRPRFKRAPSVARIELTARDLEILRQVHRHRFLRSSHIGDLLGGSRQHVLRRLQLLYHHGYLERPRAQIDYFHRGGSRAIAYGLGNKGAAHLKRELGLPLHRPDWSAKNRGAGRLFLEHALLVADVMVALELSCRRNGGVRLLTDDELALSGTTRRRQEPFRWDVRIVGGLKCGVIPDRVFGLEFIGQDGKPDRSFYFLEADRATMPVIRPDLSRSSFHRKLLAYEATWTQRLHRSRLGFHRFRVLTVTSSPPRVRTLVEACRQLERGQGLFLFTDAKTFQAHADVLSLPWHTARADVAETLSDSFSQGGRLR